MKEITKILPLNEAAKFQKSAGKYDCTITELAVMGQGKQEFQFPEQRKIWICWLVR